MENDSNLEMSNPIPIVVNSIRVFCEDFGVNRFYRFVEFAVFLFTYINLYVFWGQIHAFMENVCVMY